MPQIIPIRDLRKCAEISKMVKESSEPVFITRNGYGDMVLMSVETFEEYYAKFYIHNEIQKGLDELDSGVELKPISELFDRLDAKYGIKRV